MCVHFFYSLSIYKHLRDTDHPKFFPAHVPAGNLCPSPGTEILTALLGERLGGSGLGRLNHIREATVPYSRYCLLYQALTAALKKNEVYLFKENDMGC